MSDSLLLRAAEIAGMEEDEQIHPLNDNAVQLVRALGDKVGFAQLGVALVRVAPGCDSTEHHSHESCDEFVYILSGEAELDLGDEMHQLGPGDFAGFPARCVAHSMHNCGDQDLVYLLCGNRPTRDVTNYPRLGKVMVKNHKKEQYFDIED